MKRFVLGPLALVCAVLIVHSASAQSFARSPGAGGGAAESAELQALAKKIDEQNTKIDMLSQQILKLQLEISNSHPGVMIGEATPAPTVAAAAPATDASTHATANGNSHVVSRGETLTSIAKMHGVTVSELQKFNHIENDRKLQIGQTIMIPSGTATAPAASASPE